jgi:thiol-disulfide isomerase/thioredoxin
MFTLFCGAAAFSQIEAKAVELIEEKKPKRWNLYAQNNTDVEHEAFLIVQGEGFRRSADRPVIKKVPPNSKVLMITLIPIKGATPTYTKIFTFEEQLQTISKRKGSNRTEYVNIRPLRTNEFTVFIASECPKCDILINHLNSNHIKHRVLTLETHNKVQEFMFEKIQDLTPENTFLALPAILFKGKQYHTIYRISQFIESFDWELLN